MRLGATTTAIIAATCAALCACGEEEPPRIQSGPDSIRVVISAANGGSIEVPAEGSKESDLAGVRLVVPPGALEEDTAIKIEAPSSAILLQGVRELGPAYRITPTGLRFVGGAFLTLPLTLKEDTQLQGVAFEGFEDSGARLSFGLPKVLVDDVALTATASIFAAGRYQMGERVGCIAGALATQAVDPGDGSVMHTFHWDEPVAPPSGSSAISIVFNGSIVPFVIGTTVISLQDSQDRTLADLTFVNGVANGTFAYTLGAWQRFTLEVNLNAKSYVLELNGERSSITAFRHAGAASIDHMVVHAENAAEATKAWADDFSITVPASDQPETLYSTTLETKERYRVGPGTIVPVVPAPGTITGTVAGDPCIADTSAL